MTEREPVAGIDHRAVSGRRAVTDDRAASGRDAHARNQAVDAAVDVDALVGLADDLATGGGEVARGMLGGLAGERPRSRTKSSDTDPVTEIDTTVEQYLRERIGRARPGDVVLGEEGGQSTGGAPDAGREGASGVVRWVVDPVDGTVNLLYGIPFTAVSVAAEVHGVVVAGAVHNIVTRETWIAGRGQGARLRHPDGSESPVRVSTRTELSRTLVGTGFAYGSDVRAEQGAVVAALLPVVRDIRRCGSAALDLCMLATGRLDAYYERGLQPWDHAAGALIAAEAGAVVSVSTDYSVPTTAAAPGVAADFLAALERAGQPLSS